MSLSTPTQIDVPFADLGTRTAIPAAANNTTGRAGYDLGFPPINSTPKVAGGIPPFGSDMNGILYDITVAEQFIQAGGSWPYDSAFATSIGGYPLGALVQRSDNSGFWRNTLDGNTTDPNAGGANWQPEEAGITSVTMTGSNVTLTSLQAARNIIVINGTLTANLNLIFPTYTKNWTVSNQTTGEFLIVCKTASGSGVSISRDTSAVLFGDGTNIRLAAQNRVIVSGAVIPATSGSLISIAGIPVGIDGFDLIWDTVSLSTNDDFLIRLGSASGIESGGYSSSAALAGVGVLSTAGFIVRNEGSPSGHTGKISFEKVTGNRWVSSGCVRPNTVAGDGTNCGSKTLTGGELSQLQIFPVSSGSFDGGAAQFKLYYWSAAKS